MRKIIYITGGQRSGKSRLAQRMAEELSSDPIYLATARVWDEEFEKRIERHKTDRGEHWGCIEELINISKHDLTGKVVLMDCVTLWLTNIFTENDFKVQSSLEFARKEWNSFIQQDFTVIVVSNEIGLGVIPAEAGTRSFVDLQGWTNQHIASTSDEAYLTCSGIPIRIK